MMDNDRTSQDLEVISSRSERNEGEKRNLPRLSLTTEQFRHTQLGKIFSVTDLSPQGMGFWLTDPQDRHAFTVGAQVEGTLNLKGMKHPVQGRVRNISRDRIGMEFEAISDSLLNVIQQFLDPVRLGTEMKPLPSSLAGTLWFHGPSGTDLLVRRLNDKEFDQLCLYFLGNFMRWDIQDGLETGITEASEYPSDVRGILRSETLLLHPDSEPDSGKLSIAKTIILSSNLSQDLKDWCVGQMNRPK